MLLLVFGGPAVTSPFASCCFSCEELQDIDLELNVDNSAFYDQFAIAQVGSAARQMRCPAGREGVCPALQEATLGTTFAGPQACRDLSMVSEGLSTFVPST